MVPVVGQLVLQIKQYNDAAGYTGGQTDDI
jgi:hypothetical protein